MGDKNSKSKNIKVLNTIKADCARLSALFGTMSNGDLGELFYQNLKLLHPEVNLYFLIKRPSNSIFSKMITRVLNAICEDESGEFNAFFGCVQHINQIHSSFNIVPDAFEAFKMVLCIITADKFSSADSARVNKVFTVILNIMDTNSKFGNRNDEQKYDDNFIGFMLNHKFMHNTGVLNTKRILNNKVFREAIKIYLTKTMSDDYIYLISKIQGEFCNIMVEQKSVLLSMLGKVTYDKINKSPIAEQKKLLEKFIYHELNQKIREMINTDIMKYVVSQII